MKKIDKQAKMKKGKDATLALYDCCWHETSCYNLCCGGVCCEVQWSPTGKPVVPQNHTHLRTWALKRFGAQAPRLRWVIRR